MNTQRTDEMVNSWDVAGLFNLSRQLERELIESQEKVKELREALELLNTIAESFYVATFTNAKSRDENKAKKFAMVNEIRAILEKTK